ncbi:YrhC family protein [Fredinandcohnia quinoae]|uniref:YrhC family protein n=1 Tax=Fredinandcohnia quinoae TaxID=2918902 RepID=A0AAW5E397_9BACI|nr:YrhC family protein [Fredinandcohnia sp. SECRCQ15]MCH1627392.1 YrhC family protein [Fredinandcohnia sp. SECRCQ15]
MKDLRAKVNDFTCYGYVLLVLSVFLYIGVLIPGEEKSWIQIDTMMITTLIFLALSFDFFRLAIQYKKEINELEQ